MIKSYYVVASISNNLSLSIVESHGAFLYFGTTQSAWMFYFTFSIITWFCCSCCSIEWNSHPIKWPLCREKQNHGLGTNKKSIRRLGKTKKQDEIISLYKAYVYILSVKLYCLYTNGKVVGGTLWFEASFPMSLVLKWPQNHTEMLMGALVGLIST